MKRRENLSDLCNGSGIFLEKNNHLLDYLVNVKELKMVSFVLVSLEIGYSVLWLLCLKPLFRRIVS